MLQICLKFSADMVKRHMKTSHTEPSLIQLSYIENIYVRWKEQSNCVLRCNILKPYCLQVSNLCKIPDIKWPSTFWRCIGNKMFTNRYYPIDFFRHIKLQRNDVKDVRDPSNENRTNREQFENPLKDDKKPERRRGKKTFTWNGGSFVQHYIPTEIRDWNDEEASKM